MALIIPTDAAHYPCTATTDPDKFGEDGMTLEAMQAFVGGYIEHVGLRPPLVLDGVTYVHLVLNEEGKLIHLPVNKAATALTMLHGLAGDIIVGPAILLEQDEMQ